MWTLGTSFCLRALLGGSSGSCSSIRISLVSLPSPSIYECVQPWWSRSRLPASDPSLGSVGARVSVLSVHLNPKTLVFASLLLVSTCSRITIGLCKSCWCLWRWPWRELRGWWRSCSFRRRRGGASSSEWRRRVEGAIVLPKRLQSCSHRGASNLRQLSNRWGGSSVRRRGS